MDFLFGIFELIAWACWAIVEFIAASRVMRWFMGTVLLIAVGFVVYAALT